jgi:hypothetical protein
MPQHSHPISIRLPRSADEGRALAHELAHVDRAISLLKQAPGSARHHLRELLEMMGELRADAVQRLRRTATTHANGGHSDA